VVCEEGVYFSLGDVLGYEEGASAAFFIEEDDVWVVAFLDFYEFAF
jgi:hypothetical protein